MDHRRVHAELVRLLASGRTEVQDDHLRRLRATVDVAREIPFYRARLARLPYHFTPADFAHIPRLTRQDLRENLQSLLHPHSTEAPIPDATGGSTGTPTPFYVCPSYTAFKSGVDHLGASWVGGGLGKRTVVLWGATRDVGRGAPSWRRRMKVRWRGGSIVMGCYEASEETFDAARRLIDEVRPHVVRGYRSVLVEFARFLDERPLRWRPEAVLSAAEPLLPEHRTRIERGLGAPTFNRYGSREAGLIASEGRAKLLHVMLPSVRVEVESELGVNIEGAEGRILVTTLNNPVMPLLRYEIGDGGTWRGEGLGDQPLPVIDITAGRNAGFIELDEGVKFNLLVTFRVLREQAEVLQWQVVRTGPTRLRVDLRLDAPLDSGALDHMRAEMQQLAGGAVEIERVSAVDDVKRNATGKAELYLDAWSER